MVLAAQISSIPVEVSLDTSNLRHIDITWEHHHRRRGGSSVLYGSKSAMHAQHTEADPHGDKASAPNPVGTWVASREKVCGRDNAGDDYTSVSLAASQSPMRTARVPRPTRSSIVKSVSFSLQLLCLQ
eukprot:SAG31_NODE_2001_length_6694_cov_7.781198_3_plen_128_part_00